MQSFQYLIFFIDILYLHEQGVEGVGGGGVPLLLLLSVAASCRELEAELPEQVAGVANDLLDRVPLQHVPPHVLPGEEERAVVGDVHSRAAHDAGELLQLALDLVPVHVGLG